MDTPIVGTGNGKEFSRVILNDEKEMDIDLARQDHLDAFEVLMKLSLIQISEPTRLLRIGYARGGV